jgi:hypothetical protein
MFDQMAQQQQQQGGSPQGVPSLPATTPTLAGLAGAPTPQQQTAAAPTARRQQRDPGPVLPANVDEALAIIANTTGLLNEMLASETDPREGFVSELAEQCVRMQR